VDVAFMGIIGKCVVGFEALNDVFLGIFQSKNFIMKFSSTVVVLG
jgi:hypothetical protein